MALQDKSLVWRAARGIYAREESALSDLMESNGLLKVDPSGLVLLHALAWCCATGSCSCWCSMRHCAHAIDLPAIGSGASQRAQEDGIAHGTGLLRGAGRSWRWKHTPLPVPPRRQIAEVLVCGGWDVDGVISENPFPMAKAAPRRNDDACAVARLRESSARRAGARKDRRTTRPLPGRR